MRTLIITLIILITSPAFAEWQYQEKSNEMGDMHVEMAFTYDSDPDYDAMFGVAKEDRVGIILVLYVKSERFPDGNEIDVKIDDGEIIPLHAIRDGKLFMTAPSKTLIHMLKTGKAVKVRFETQSDIHTVDFSLDGSAAAINKLQGGEK
ncbi:MAG: hypothetical protein ACOC4Y_01390 [bacterium]